MTTEQTNAPAGWNIQPINETPAPGWQGGYLEKHPEMNYPTVDLSHAAMNDNLKFISKLERQQKVIWPEFSWETVRGHPRTRCYQMFAPDISRLGYDSAGRTWSIICPQQGACVDDIGCLNVEVTVTGQRGWVDEPEKMFAADMMVDGTIWFSPNSHSNWFVQEAWELFEKLDHPFPATKEHAIKVSTHKLNDYREPIFPLRKGTTTRFPIPNFAKHPEAWDVGNLDVQIGPIRKTGDARVDVFNQKVLNIFNMASGNMLQVGNVLTWNVWFTAPELVDQEEWAHHAELWRTSIDADHGPVGETSPRFYDGTEFKPQLSLEAGLRNFLQMMRELI